MTRRLDVQLNGRATELECADSDLLLDVLRDKMGLTGAKRSCDIEICGACTVLLDGEPVSGCATLAYEAGGRTVDTIEGVAGEDELHPLQRAFIEHGALQCGFCTPGMVMTVLALLAREPNPTREQVIEGLEGNLCRCTGYFKIVDAVLAFCAEAGRTEAAPSQKRLAHE
ncbi:MAG: (2Fe-2S)-binding protein [Actinomycetota bacterium]|nr:(2Fe-2S)-binding protein [Actinomycetota bacterium]